MAPTRKKSLRSAIHQELIQLLQQKRKEAGLSQQAIAANMGWPQSDISKVETGERRLDVVEFLQFCEAINIQAEDAISELKKRGRSSK